MDNIACRFSNSTYDDGDRFFIHTFAPWPHERDVGPTANLGSFRIGNYSDIMALRFRLKSGELLLHSSSGYGFLGWSQQTVGDTRMIYASTSQWPKDPPSPNYFSDSYSSIYTSSWKVVASGVPIRLFRDSTLIENNRFASDMVFFGFYINDDDRGVKDAQTKFWFEVI